MGLHVNIFRTDALGDCTNGGVSSQTGVKGFCLTNVSGPFDPDANYPAAKLKKGAYNSVNIVPAWNEDEQTMFGGNYAATSDSRFSQAIKELLGHEFYGAIAIHDRTEVYAVYD